MVVKTIFRYLSIFSILLPLLYSLYLLQFTKNKLVWQIFWFSAFITVVEALGWVTGRLYSNNLWISHVYIPVEYALLAYMFKDAFRSSVTKRFIDISIVVFVLFCVMDSMLLESLTLYNAYPRVIESILLVLLALLYFYQELKDLQKVSFLNDPYFLLSVAVLFSFAGTSITNSLFNVMLEYPRVYMNIGRILTHLLNIFLNVMLVLVLRRAPKA